jgi:hypothetical protein
MSTFNWTKIVGFHFEFEADNLSFANQSKQFNKEYQNHIRDPEDLFINTEDGTQILALDPIKIIKELIVQDIMIDLTFDGDDERTETENRITMLLSGSLLTCYTNSGKSFKIRNQKGLISLAEQTHEEGGRNIQLKFNISHWKFCRSWHPSLFSKIYLKDHEQPSDDDNSQGGTKPTVVRPPAML